MNNFNPKNSRAEKTKLKKYLFHKPLFFLLSLLFVAAILCGGILLYFKNPLGWTVLGFSVIFPIFKFWIKNELDEITIGKTDDINDILSENAIKLLCKFQTPASLAQNLYKTPSGEFLTARFQLPSALLVEITKYLPDNFEPIFHTARQIRDKTDSKEIGGAVLMVAIIENFPNHEKILSQMKLTISDLYQGIIWFNYLNGRIKNAKKPIKTGGIARDFTFGYTPNLQHFAVNISKQRAGAHTQIQQADHSEIIQKIINTFTTKGRQNIALVGPYGSGRSTIVNSLAETLMDASVNLPHNLKFRQIFSLDVSSLLSATSRKGELENLMINILNEIYAAKNIILCLDNAHLFFEEGAGSIDISNLLLPVLESGNIRVILIMDDQKFLKISATKPALANTLNKIIVTPADKNSTLKILQDQVPFLEYQKNVTYTYKSILEAYRLSDRYIHDVEMPGKAKLLLESAANFTENNIFVTENSVQKAIEKTTGVKLQTTTDSVSREKLLNLEDLIHARMINQTEAVSAVASALRRAGAGVRNTNRPIGTFLFLGPTGVGKTELAKSLANVYFNGENNIIRLDLNEFVNSTDVARLLQDGAVNELSLAAQVMKQPFSVILLDEIEKAHPQVLTTLLQVLDEGILRDEKNREISFRDTIIIATSNAGANTIRDKISAGASIFELKEPLINELINANEFKPEFLNRFDEICLFKPLSKTDLAAILDLIIASTNHTLEPQKISVTLDQEAKQILINQGYDPTMGARPMRRTVQKTVENIVAKAILSGEAKPGSSILITKDHLI